MINWFNVGDEVIIHGCTRERLNGVEGVIHKVLKPNLLHFCRLTGKWCKNVDNEEAYLLETPYKNPSDLTEVSFKRSSLKKKQHPSTDSFKVMMKKLKSGETI